MLIFFHCSCMETQEEGVRLEKEAALQRLQWPEVDNSVLWQRVRVGWDVGELQNTESRLFKEVDSYTHRSGWRCINFFESV